MRKEDGVSRKGLSVNGGTEVISNVRILPNGAVLFGGSRPTDHLDIRRGDVVPGTRRRQRNPGQRF